jgi:hypothetical protein
MRRFLPLATLLAALSASTISFCEAPRVILDPRSIYITSNFDCPVYWNNRPIALLRSGTRARIIRSTKDWILVSFRGRGREITGWIKR